MSTAQIGGLAVGEIAMATKDEIRALLLTTLRQRDVKEEAQSAPGSLGSKAPTSEDPLIRQAMSEGLLSRSTAAQGEEGQGADGAHGPLVVTKAGRAWLRRMAAAADPFQEQHQERQMIGLPGPRRTNDTGPIMVNVASGPLLWLRHRTDRKGEPLISEAQFRAGQRFAAELEKGAVTAGYARGLTLGQDRVDGGRGALGTSEALSDGALTARRNIDRATAFLGKDLSKVAIDVCFYEVKLADIEKRHGWPVRSAKVVLAIALDRLACHYGYSTEVET